MQKINKYINIKKKNAGAYYGLEMWKDLRPLDAFIFEWHPLHYLMI